MTSDQTGFPVERDTDEVINSKDVQMGRNTTRYLHPGISTYIAAKKKNYFNGEVFLKKTLQTIP
jgi:hypothetical protein